MDYGPSHTWHRTQRLRYIIILVENDVMHFKTFVLRTPSVPLQMMSLALCLGGREVVKWFVGVFRLMLSPSWGGRAELSDEWKGREGSKLGCRQLFITEPDDNVTHNKRPWCNCTDVDCWVRGRGKETDAVDMTWLQIRVWPTCMFRACCQSQDFWKKVDDSRYSMWIILFFFNMHWNWQCFIQSRKINK